MSLVCADQRPVPVCCYGPDGSMWTLEMIGSRSQPVSLPWLSTVIATTGATGISPFRPRLPRLAACRIGR